MYRRFSIKGRYHFLNDEKREIRNLIVRNGIFSCVAILKIVEKISSHLYNE